MVVDVEVKITSMQGTHIFRRDRTTQLIKCTPWRTRLCPHPTIIKKMKTFLEVEGKMGPIPTPSSQFRPHSQTLSQKRGREPCPRRSSDQQPPSLLQCTHPCQRPCQNLRVKHPYLQYQYKKAPHGLVQAKCQGTFLRRETSCSLKIIQPVKIKMKTQLVSLAQDPQ